MPAGPERYRAVLDNLDEVVFETDTTGRWTYLNAAWTKITGWAVGESLGCPFLESVHPDDRDATLALFEAVVNGPADHCHHETRYLTADGSYRWIELRASMLLDETGAYIGNVGTILDITDRRRAEELLDEQNSMLEMVARGKSLEDSLGALGQCLAKWTAHEVTVMTEPGPDEPGHGRPTGKTIAVVARPGGQGPVPLPSAAELVVGGDDVIDVPVHAVDDDDARLGRFLLRPTGNPRSLEEHEQALVDRCVHLAAIAIGRERLDAEARHKALHDPLTGLPNRALITDRLKQALSLSSRQHTRVALLLLDLDHFKVINDTFGHEMGDRVLQQVAERFVNALRDSDTVGRLGGDEFAIVLPDVIRDADGESVAVNIRQALGAPMRVEGVDFYPEVSIGIAVSSGAQDQPADLFRFADVAMYRVKREGGGYALYDPARDAERLRNFHLAGELREAIRNDELVLHYQPKVALDSGRVVGIESLVRWKHPARGLIRPNDFVPLAEMTGAVRPLFRWVLQNALAESRNWDTYGFRGAVSVNISAQSLHDPELPQIVGELLAQDRHAGGRPRLELEITENAIMGDPEGAVSAMSQLEDLGVLFSIDDFGTGYSSLSHLKLLPVRAIKIDKSFVRDMERDDRDAFIVRTAVALAHDLHIDVIAEGVESQQVLELLKELKCDSAQGYFFARPMSRGQLGAWLRAQR